MLTEHELVGERLALYKLMKKYPDWGHRRLAKALGHDPGWVANWRKRLSLDRPLRLDDLRSRSRRPKHCPQRPSSQAQALVLELRHTLSERFHRPAGAKTILFGLKEYRQQHPDAPPLPKSRSAIYRILHEHGRLVPPPQVKHTPVVLPPPMEEWEMDFGEIYLPDEEGVFEFFIVVDRGTSRLVYIEYSTGYNAETALQAVLRLFMHCGMPKRIRFDRDPRLWGSWTRDSYPSALVRLLRVLGVEDVICPPRRPDKKGFVERCIQTVKYEWLARHAPTTLAEASACLATFPSYYHAQRPHQGQACQNRTPDQAFPPDTLPKLPQLPNQVHPDAWVTSLQGRVYRRRVNADGTIQIDRHTYRIGSRYQGKAVGARVVGKQIQVECAGEVIGQFALQGLHDRTMSLAEYSKILQDEARTIDLHYRSQWRRQSDA